MRKENRKDVIDLIKKELTKGVHTFTMCDCGRHGCRSSQCWECWLETLL